MIRKFLSAAVLTAVIGVSAIATPTAALADGYYRHGGYNHGYHRGPGIGAGIAAGIIGGALIGGVIANSGPRYVETPVYEDDYVTCQRVRVRDDEGNIYYRRVCD